MTQDDVAHRLLEFLDEHAFGPVLSARPEGYPAAQGEALRAAQTETRRERERFEPGASASQVYRTYHEELAAPGSAALHRRLRELALPALEDVRIDFEQMASDLGIGTSGSI
jgi:hypothetical protein